MSTSLQGFLNMSLYAFGSGTPPTQPPPPPTPQSVRTLWMLPLSWNVAINVNT